MVGIFVHSGRETVKFQTTKKPPQAVPTVLTHLIRRARNIGTNNWVARLFSDGAEGMAERCVNRLILRAVPRAQAGSCLRKLCRLFPAAYRRSTIQVEADSAVPEKLLDKLPRFVYFCFNRNA
jgi:hypothetical protein